MKEKYSYKSEWIYLVGFGWMASAFFMMLLGFGLSDAESAIAIFVIWGLWFISMIVSVFLLECMPASFEADEKAVTFKLLFRTITIPYSDIEKMEINRIYTKVIIRGDVPHYEEYFNIWCKNQAYEFHKAMDIDMDTVAEHPEQLQEEFEKGTFSQLQNYIHSYLLDSL
ncbi:MAG TPA: hypothetical protein DCO72_09890 [Ruminococcus sp.]|nr:hypothetical protein [Ruminococcus sp.]